MKSCPNCGIRLRLTDWRPECPGCGVNLNYFRANERLLEESEAAEAEHALFQPKVDRAKAAYIGSPKAILRMVFTLLPVGALFLPLALLEKKMNVIDLYNLISEKGAGFLLSSGAFGVWAILLALSAARILINLFFLIASLGKHGKGRTAVLYGVMLGCTLASMLAFLSFQADPTKVFPTLSAAALGYGAEIYAALQAFSFGWSVYLLKTGLPVSYTETTVGGIPSKRYFEMVKEGWNKEDIRRKMLEALALQTEDPEREEETV